MTDPETKPRAEIRPQTSANVVSYGAALRACEARAAREGSKHKYTILAFITMS